MAGRILIKDRKQVYTFALRPSIKALLGAHAAATGRSMSVLLEDAIRQYIGVPQPQPQPQPTKESGNV